MNKIVSNYAKQTQIQLILTQLANQIKIVTIILLNCKYINKK